MSDNTINQRSLIAGVVMAGTAIAVTVVALLAGGGPAPKPDIAADRSNVFGHPALPSAHTAPTGRAADTAADFGRDPCAVVTVDELGLAMAQPFHNLTGTLLRRDRSPARAANGCAYAFLADGTDTAETYHQVIVTLKHLPAEGAKLLSDCLAGAAAIPRGRVDVGDEACLGPASTLVLRLGTNHYTIAVGASPLRADRKDEEIEFAPLIKAAAKLFATRLPAK